MQQQQEQRFNLNNGLPSPPPPPPVRRRRARRSRRSPSPQPQPYINLDIAYLNRYANVGVHEEMIKDHVRTVTYRDAIMHHAVNIAGKVVIDVGCGTGILSIFCAQAGAKTVYAVEASNIAIQAQSVIEANNLSHIIKVLHGRVEDVEIKEKVDVIVSEWMGYMLLYENMLGSVITARDRWLKPGGLMIPSDATLYMAPITNINKYNETTEFWRNVYGIDMSAMIPSSIQCKFEEPSVETISADNVLARPHVVKRIDCHSVTIPELLFVTSKFKFTSTFQATLHGFAFWFDAEFNGPVLAPEPISWVPPTSSPDNHPEEEEDGSKRKREPNPKVPFLSTSPGDPSTHWYQSSIYLYDTIEVEKDQLIEGSVILSQCGEHGRFLNIQLEYASGGHSYLRKSVFN